jgi:hypothetical protein
MANAVADLAVEIALQEAATGVFERENATAAIASTSTSSQRADGSANRVPRVRGLVLRAGCSAAEHEEPDAAYFGASPLSIGRRHRRNW